MSASAPTPHHRPGPVLRALLHAPTVLYHLRLGWLLGHRFLLLRHVGRKTGRVRENVLEVVRYDRRTRESVVVAAWGEGAAWYRNIRAQPPLEVRTARVRYHPRCRFLESDEARAVLRAYVAHHRLAARVIGRLFGYRLGDPEGFEEFLAGVRLVAFSPATPRERSP